MHIVMDNMMIVLLYHPIVCRSYSFLFCFVLCLCFTRRSVKALRRQPPVDSEDLSRDVARCRQTQKDDRIRYLFRARQPSHRGPSFDLVELGRILRNGVLEHGCHLVLVVSVEKERERERNNHHYYCQNKNTLKCKKQNTHHHFQNATMLTVIHGATALTRIFRCAHSQARILVKWLRAALLIP